MSGELDAFVNQLQDTMDSEAMTYFGDAAVERWKNPQYMGVMENPSAVGTMTGDCGDTVKMFLEIEGQSIIKALGFTSGCGPSVVSCDVVAEFAQGKTLDQAAEIDGNQVLEILGGLPEEKEHCAHLAASALHDAIGAWYEKNPT